MDYKQAFLSQLENSYLGVQIQDAKDLFSQDSLSKEALKKSGFINLLQMKSKYFQHIKNLLEKEKLNHSIYTKLYNFFSSYLNETGTPFFYDTPMHKNIYAKVYTNSKDTSLFYKTQNLYYVKSDTLYHDAEITSQDSKHTFIFDTSHFIPNADNAKNKAIFKFTIEENIRIYVLNDKESLKELPNVFKQNSGDLSDEFIKSLKDKKIQLQEEEIKKILSSYKRQNEIDFFIHKNARAFLQEQFNLWLCNYVLDDITQWRQEKIEELNTLKKVAFTIIDYIADFEDELKAIWCKPKFAKKVEYVFSLDRIDSALLDSVINDEGFKAQIKEWQELRLIDESFDIKNINDEKYKFLPIDTKHFSKATKYKILSSFKDLESTLNGELIKSDNFQALNTLLPKYQNKVDLIYIDPPYNTGNDGFVYTDKFNHSSWLTMMSNRLELAKKFLKDSGSMFVSIDDNEQARLKILCDEVFGEENFMANLIWLKRNAQNDANTIQKNQEYILSYGKNIILTSINQIIQEEKVKVFQDEKTGGFYYEGSGLTTGGAGGTLNARPNLGYSIYYNPKTKDFFAKDDYDKELAKVSDDEKEVYTSELTFLENGYEVIRPPKKGVRLGRWTWALDKFNALRDDILIRKNGSRYFVLKKEWLNPKKVKKDENGNYYAITAKTNPPKSYIDFVGSGIGSKELMNIFENKIFDTPKPERLLKRICDIGSNQDSLILDFFAGSGTTIATAHKLGRKWLGVEMGEHFYKVIIPRMKKVIGGFVSGISKEVEFKGGGAFRYYELESYEESLANCEYVLDFSLDNDRDISPTAQYDKAENFQYDRVGGSQYNKTESHSDKISCHIELPLRHSDLEQSEREESNDTKYSIINYRKSRKLIKGLKKGEKICLDMSKYDKNFDIFVTMSNLLGLKIKNIFLDKNGIESCKFENDEIVDLENIDIIRYSKLRNLIWWER